MSKNNLLEEIDNLANTCLDFNLESIEEILKDRKSFQSLSKIKECLILTERYRQKKCIINSLLLHNCKKETMDVEKCTKKFGSLVKTEGKCFEEINSFVNCLESELSYLNLITHV